MAEKFDVAGRGRFYEEAGAIRDVVQNHLLQILALIAMEPPVDPSGGAADAAKVALLECVRPLHAGDVVRGQYRGYREEDGVAPNSQVETYVSARLDIDNPRWAGVPFVIRAGKCLDATTQAGPGAVEAAGHAALRSGGAGAERILFPAEPGGGPRPHRAHQDSRRGDDRRRRRSRRGAAAPPMRCCLTSDCSATRSRAITRCSAALRASRPRGASLIRCSRATRPSTNMTAEAKGPRRHSSPSRP